MDVGFMPGVNVPRTSLNPGEMDAVELGCRTVSGFPQIDSVPGECGAVELDFCRASFPPGESGAEECDYIRPAPLAGSSVCARTVTGSPLFGSPHRLVWCCLYSAVLSLQWIDDLDISRESTGIPQNHHLGTVVSRITPDICLSVWTVRLGIYLVPLNFAKIMLIFLYFYRVFAARAMASGRSPDMDQVIQALRWTVGVFRW